jgi:hypothetical protein
MACLCRGLHPSQRLPDDEGGAGPLPPAVPAGAGERVCVGRCAAACLVCGEGRSSHAAGQRCRAHRRPRVHVHVHALRHGFAALPAVQVRLRASLARGRADVTKLEALERIAHAKYKKQVRKGSKAGQLRQQGANGAGEEGSVLGGQLFASAQRAVARARDAVGGGVHGAWKNVSVRSRRAPAAGTTRTATVGKFALVARLRELRSMEG